jgi:hypothetical protein
VGCACVEKKASVSQIMVNDGQKNLYNISIDTLLWHDETTSGIYTLYKKKTIRDAVWDGKPLGAVCASVR